MGFRDILVRRVRVTGLATFVDLCRSATGMRAVRGVEKTVRSISNERTEDMVCRLEGKPVDWICLVGFHQEIRYCRTSQHMTKVQLPAKRHLYMNVHLPIAQPCSRFERYQELRKSQ